MKRCLPPLAVLLALVSLPAFAAPARGPMERRLCGTPEPGPADLERGRAAVESFRRFGPLAVGGTIKVAWHVIHSGAEGDLPRRRIADSIRELNRAYRGTGYSFELASVDRTNHSTWFRMLPGTGLERNAKQALAVDVPHRLNVYSCKPGLGYLGWSYFPQSIPEGHYLHGVVIHYGTVPGGHLAPYNLGGTLDHETGHYLGLYHTFQNGCEAPGDFVDDTPFEATPNFGCPESRNTCPDPGDDPIHNYMDYSDDVCYTEFTRGQDQRMDAIVPVYRPSLLGAAIQAPGTDLEIQRVEAREPAALFRGAFPNPFGVETALRFYLPERARVTVRIYDVAGQRVLSLADGDLGAGEHSLTLSAGSLPAGTYFADVRLGERAFRRSLILVR